MRTRILNRPSGQSILEYALVTAVVAAALTAMTTYVRRAVQANLQAVQDRLNGEALP